MPALLANPRATVFAALLSLLSLGVACGGELPVVDDKNPATDTKMMVGSMAGAPARGAGGNKAAATKEKFVCNSDRKAELLRARNGTDKLKLMVLNGNELYFVERGAMFDTLRKFDLGTRAETVLDEPKFRFESMLFNAGQLYFSLVSEDLDGGIYSLAPNGGKRTLIADYPEGVSVPIFAISDKYVFGWHQTTGPERVDLMTGKWATLPYAEQMKRPHQHPDGLWFQVQESGPLSIGTYVVDLNADLQTPPRRVSKGDGGADWSLTSNGVFYYSTSYGIRHYALDTESEPSLKTLYNPSQDDGGSYVPELTQSADGNVFYFYPHGTNTKSHPIRSMDVNSFAVSVVECDRYDVSYLRFDATYLYFIENGGDAPGIYRVAK